MNDTRWVIGCVVDALYGYKTDQARSLKPLYDILRNINRQNLIDRLDEVIDELVSIKQYVDEVAAADVAESLKIVTLPLTQKDLDKVDG